MAKPQEITVREFVNLTVRQFVDLIKELNEHEAELKIKLAKAGVVEPATQAAARDEATPA
jgi:hypothetical protein